MSKRMLFLSVTLVVSVPSMCMMYPLGIVAAAAGTYMICTYEKHKTAWEIECAKTKVAAARARVKAAEERASTLAEGSFELDIANAEVDSATTELDELLEQLSVVLDAQAAQERERERYEQEPYWFEKVLQEAHKREVDEQQRARDSAEEHDFFFNTKGLAPEVVKEREELRLALWNLKNPDNTQKYLKDCQILKERIEALKLAWHPDKQITEKRIRCGVYYRIVSRSIDEYLAWLRSQQPDIDKRLKEVSSHKRTFIGRDRWADNDDNDKHKENSSSAAAQRGACRDNEEWRLSGADIKDGYVWIAKDGEAKQEDEQGEVAARASTVLNVREVMSSIHAQHVMNNASARDTVDAMD